MANFEVNENGDVTLSFNVDEVIAYADITDTDGGGVVPHTADIKGFAEVIAHMVEKKPSNCCTLGFKTVLQQMGLKRFRIRSSNWIPLGSYCRNKTEAMRRYSHLKGVTVTEDKKWAKNE